MNAAPGGRRLRIEWWVVALLSSAIVLFLVADRTAARLDNLVYDGLLQLTERAPSPDIAIVAVDNNSLREIGPWPWPRETHARLVKALADAHPRAIGYDVLFVEPGPGDGDRQLGQALAEVASFLPLLMDRPGRNGADFDAIEPVAPIRAGARAIGHANLTFDRDGLVRRMDLLAGDGARQWPQLTELMRREAGRGTGAVAGVPPPQRVMISYAGPPGHFPTMSAASVLRGQVPPELLRSRLILVGVTADGLGDQYPVPFGDKGGVMPGVEIHANLLDAMLGRHVIRPIEGVRLAIVSLIPLWLLLLAFRWLRPRATALLLGGLLILIVAGTAALLLGGLWLPPASAMIAIAIVYPLWGWRRLEAMSAYMTAELIAFNEEPDILPRTPADIEAGDMVERQSLLLHDAIDRMRAMRRFVSDRLHQLPDATFVTDREGRILLANGEAEKLAESLGIGPAPGQLADLLVRLEAPSEDGRATPPGLPVAETQEAVMTEVSAADGRNFDLRFAPQRDDNDALIGWIVLAIDTSAARASERQRERILQLLTHDMRSPQSSIIALIEGATPEDISAKTGRRIEAYARRTLSLADDFVQLARAEAVDQTFEALDLGDILIEAIDELWPQSSARGIKVDLIGADDGLLILGERSMISRAFINLIGNAIKYSHDGGEVRCVLHADEATAMAVCSIADDGVGIASDQLDHLFDPFRRAQRKDGQGPDGVGLGLALVRTVVTRHHGTIRCESRLGTGTTFTIALPLADA